MSEQNLIPDENAHDHDLYQRALSLLEMRLPIEAAQIAAPLEQRERVPESYLELLARAYFNSAQLGNAERVLRRLIEQSPANGWAHRVLARTLARRNADVEAARYHRIADGFGVA
ncbi:tetratricopeptide repeat protein [Kineosporia sp. J2-2]|uniref:Tetratricopeptide repeat protein n=1 Tax=Kineosporia corallincola TaxID=2835133 RepID=A0ABS5TKX2_9ACTN|nr:tetratricopeptide repeat protein [Kineosporia corallincola]MBT0771488.1 tetratricopeptide repeat protein [Kineosporia corallincola]